MADTKISALPAATTPLAGTEVLPIVQSGVTEKVAVDDLTVKNIRSNATNGILQIVGPAAAATRVMTTPDANFTAARTDAAQSFTGDQTLSTGNLVIGTNGKGIDFSATPGTGTSELLSDYEEGTFTSTISAYAGTFTTVAATMKYVKVGKQVTVSFTVSITSNGTASGNIQLTVPFTSDSGVGYCGSAREGASTGTMSSVSMVPSDNKLAIQTYNNLYPGGDGYNIDGSLTYFVA